MINVGVIGLGMMGNTHLDVYSQLGDRCKVVAISDIDPDRLSGKVRAGGNIEGQAQGSFDINAVKKYDEGKKLIKDKSIDLVDICLWTPLHLEYAKAALRNGKHVLCEKPMGRTYREARKLQDLGEKSDRQIMIAMCMRFWPGWTWLKQAVCDNRYGRVLAAQFRRVANHPGGRFYSDGAMAGGAILDLHIHDTDFIQYLFGTPKSVMSAGYSQVTSAIDHVATRYEYENIPLVVAEGGWAMSQGFGFKMEYTVNFERATAVFNLANKDTLTVSENGQTQPVPLQTGMGYQYEIEYFLDCVANNRRPETVTLASSAESVKIVEAEEKSVKSGKPVKVK
jgi:predicted dehydrogenase